MNEKTQPLNNESTVLYRCSCGAELKLSADVGGKCPACAKTVSPKALHHELAMTMTIQTEIDPTDSQGLAKIKLAQTKHDSAQIDDPNSLIGKMFGHFEIVTPIGSGGMGQVYRALDNSLQRFVAVKVLRSGIGSTSVSTSSENEVDMLLQEAVSQARVTHPNIVTIYYVGKQDGDPFLAMELIMGNPLSNLIAAGRLSFAHIGPIAIQIVGALEFSYELDIIHGDIKPSNILVQTNGLTKISDFGMARRASDDESGRLGGTPNYIAPELLTGLKPTIQSDMYALGVTFYEMTFGRLPVVLKGTTIPQWLETHQSTEISFPSPWPDSFPEQWRDVLAKLLASEPEDRYTSYTELLKDLESMKPESRILARRTPRLMAAGIDWFTVILLMAPVELAVGFEPFGDYFTAHPVLEFLLQLADFIPIIIYTAILFFWRQSIGRNLMHVRVVNQYGLIPSQNTMIMRSVLRMILPWVSCFVIFFENSTAGWSQAVAITLLLIAAVYWLLDIAFLMIYQHGRSLHDLIFGTRVVLDTD